MLGIERVMTHVARELGMDPAELRRRNYYAERVPGGHVESEAHGVEVPEGDVDVASRGSVGAVGAGRVPEVHGPGGRTHYGMPVTDFVLGDMTARLLETADYAGRRAAVETWKRRAPGAEEGHRLQPGEVRHQLHAHAPQPGRGRWCTSIRTGPSR